MYNFESLYETGSGPTSVIHPPSAVKGVDVRVEPVSVTGRIGSRTRHNRYYSDEQVEADEYSLKDKKYRSLWPGRSYFTQVGNGRNGTYTEQFPYKPQIPRTSNADPVEVHVSPRMSTQIDDVMILSDAKHAFNAAEVNTLSHGGVRDIEYKSGVDPAVTPTVPTDGPDTVDLGRMRGLNYQFHYTDPSNMHRIARQNFMSAMADKVVDPYHTARPAPV